MSKAEFLDSTIAELVALQSQFREKEKRLDFRFGRLLTFVHGLFKRKQDPAIEPLEWFGHEKAEPAVTTDKELFETLKTNITLAGKKKSKKNV